MALPNQLKTARMTNATQVSQVDDEVGNLERAIADILGIPIDTDIALALKGWQLIQSQAASTSATIDFTTGLDSTYDLYKVDLANVLPSDDGTNLNLRVSQSSTFLVGATDYQWVLNRQDAATPNPSSGAQGSTGANVIIINVSTGNAVGEGVNSTLYFSEPDVVALKRFWWHVVLTESSPVLANITGAGALILNSTAIDGLRFFFNSGTILSGTLALYGLRK